MASGWNKPLLHRWEFNLNLLQRELRDHSPGSDRNQLKNSWKLNRNSGLSVNAKGDGVTIRNELVYARIRDRGGIIRAKNAPYLVFKYMGQWFKKKSVMQKRTDYIRKAVDAFAGNQRSIKARWGRVGDRS